MRSEERTKGEAKGTGGGGRRWLGFVLCERAPGRKCAARGRITCTIKLSCEDGEKEERRKESN